MSLHIIRCFYIAFAVSKCCWVLSGVI